MYIYCPIYIKRYLKVYAEKKWNSHSETIQDTAADQSYAQWNPIYKKGDKKEWKHWNIIYLIPVKLATDQREMRTLSKQRVAITTFVQHHYLWVKYNASLGIENTPQFSELWHYL